MQNIALIIAVVVPIVLLLVFRTNAAVVFLSLCAGALAVQFVGNEANLVGSAIGNHSEAVSQYFELALLVLPALLSAIFLAKTMGGPKTVFNILPAIAVGVIGVLLAVPLLPNSLQTNITSLDGWTLLNQSKEFVVMAGIVASLVVLWITHPRHHGKHKKH